MKLGIIYPQNGLGGDPAAVREIGLAGERLGFNHLVAYDHVLGATHDREPKLGGPYTEKDPFHDPFVMFGYLAALTNRIEFVTGVLILPQRQTALVARQAADVDLLSGGRLRLGAGIGWNYVEYDALGQDFSKRGRRVGEQVALLRELWTGNLVTFEGEFDTIDRAALVPRPSRQIPIWMGGFADVALRRAAGIADGFIFADGAADAFAQLASLDGYLADAGRDASSFGKQCHMLRAKSADDAISTALRWRDAGGTHATVNSMGLGFANASDHVAYFEKVANAAIREGLL
ncbi:LLM class F420-dependent oxidoreductase [Novosphingobium album (ex Hu et al. 2023)]|uniref:LLM class F420-dependent oxidoreductase n=1 Tax=Novosphingobium album (ex Hu et al. 2023) TaxID=2930093 RepID=A0ABT0B7Z0_9SPHN|nr:LLM class F420-dependent oxidoreductase [Novosphingobium album (ex Hu et al. 2023)]MCJ2181005.1 LLM class F420-dependent oxidoreductase [Novosphingobium album (ex Hu et al. 2023)]